ncbi:MAG TPA: hypothetical protein VN132_05385 [Bdellovibrio sp.]|nr:hypothetical protein [Bdellovibrio sp.]
MSRNSLLTILIFFFAAASLWFFSLKKDIKKTQDLVAEQQQLPTTSTLTKNVTRSVANEAKSARRDQLENEISALQQTLYDEQQKLNSKNRFLTNLKERQTQQSQQQPPSYYSSQIASRDEQIQDLLSGSRDFRSAEQSLNQRAAQELRNQSSAAQLARDQLDENIRQQEALIKQTEEDLDTWKYNFGYVVEQEAHLAELSALLEAQKQRLQDMRTQRLEISATALSQSQAVNNSVQETASSYSDSQDAIYDEVNSLREEIRRLEQQRNQVHTSQMSLNSQVNQAQRDVRDQSQQVQNLQDSLQQKVQELQTLHE